MIRQLRLLDVPTYTFDRNRSRTNRVFTLGNLVHNTVPRTDIARLYLATQRSQCCAIAEQSDSQNISIIAAKPRAGLGTWELSHLLLHDDNDTLTCKNLLNTLIKEASLRGAERIFIRLRADDSLIPSIRNCGFVIANEETLYMGKRGIFSGTKRARLRPKRTNDEYNVFRLYNTATPASVRFAYGMTFDQWQLSIERRRLRTSESVYDSPEGIQAWARVIQGLGSAQISLMLLPDPEESISSIIEYCLSRTLPGTSKVQVLVPEYQAQLHRVLEQHRFKPAARYVTLVRWITAAVKDHPLNAKLQYAGIGPSVELIELQEWGQSEKLRTTNVLPS